MSLSRIDLTDIVSWRELLSYALKRHNETWEDVVSCTLSDDELNRAFDRSYGGPEGKPFTLWTRKRVYYPFEYDGAENVRSVSRIPDGIPTKHNGE